MATIGMDKLYYAKITEDASGNETYGTPAILAKAMNADLSVEIAEATLYADDAVSEVVKAFKQGKLTLGVDDLADGVAEDLTGAHVDENGVLISAVEDSSVAVAIGFRAKKPSGKYRYFWLYRVVFSIPTTSLATKGDSITFSTPSIEGTVLRRNKAGGDGTHPWKAEVTEGNSGVPAQTIENWYGAVYEPNYGGAYLTALTLGSITLTPAFNAGTLSYMASTSNATNTVTATPADGATAVIKVNGSTVQSGSSVSWTTGSNTVTVTVTKGSSTKTYTVTVTKGA